MASSSSRTSDVEDLRASFSPYDVRRHPDKYVIKNLHKIMPLKEASVLIPLFYKNDDLHILLTLRSRSISSFGSEVVFPGGMKDDADADSIETAIRETEEEVGVAREHIDVIAVLPPMVLSTMSVVTPVLALLGPGFEVVPNKNEVSLVFDLPLKRFLSEDRLALFHYDGFVDYNFSDTVRGQRVNTWGFTASVCLRVAIVALQSDLKIMVLPRNRTATKHDCFNMAGTNAFVEELIKRKSAKL